MWWYRDDEGEGSFLGEAREDLYREIPEELWGELTAIIAGWEDAKRFGRACDDAAREAWEKGIL